MKNIMCFGDSNTYGINPKTGLRFPRDMRWTGILQKLLGEEYYVIEEGLGGRTTVWEDPLADNRCGIKALPMLLDSHLPLDMVILMLGSNDWKYRFGALPEDVAAGVEKLVKLIHHHPFPQSYSVPDILIVAPIPKGEQLEKSPYTGFVREAIAYSKKLPVLLEDVAKRYGCLYLNAGEAACADEADQIHMNEASHKSLAKLFARTIEGHFKGK